MSHQNIREHEGRKYLRLIHPADGAGEPIWVDVYEVLAAFAVPDQPTGHAAKKALTAGQRGKGNRLADLIGARAALDRAIDLERRRVEEQNQELRELQEDSGLVPSKVELQGVINKHPEATTYHDDGAIPFPPPSSSKKDRKPEDALQGHHLHAGDDTCRDCGRHTRELTTAWMNRGIKVDCAAVPKNPA